ncbi:MAG: MotA/TolQ/ExbB proton channel family protein [Acidobacteria bacterium]|nr:MotA/TolQ/ExbB proton channel family protein [Acidobacteriota bacterium]MBI3657513.1 MotA/TolQ/ExbB proton channel family protein [Acidobacteriota bacterium]
MGGLNLVEMLKSMTPLAIGVVVILLIMSFWSITIMIERYLTFRTAKKQSLVFAPAVVECLKDNRIDEAINLAEQHKKSHLAKVLASGLQEFQAHVRGGEIPGEIIESSRRALERATALGVAEFKRGISGLATIGSTAPFVGLFGTTIGIINAFQGMRTQETAGIGAVAGGISEALVTTALGLFVAVPAVWMYNYFINRVEVFTVEMDNISSELVDYFLKKRR